MTNIVTFIPLTNQDATEKLLSFIEFCRTKLKPFGREIDFDKDIWDITGLTGKSYNYKTYIRFTQLGVKVRQGVHSEKNSQILNNNALLREPFMSFAKAMMSYQHSIRPTKAIPTRLSALRYLEAALYELNGSTCPTGTTPQVLNRACTLAIESLGKHASYNYAKSLEKTYRLMAELGLLALPSTWLSTIPSVQNRRSRVGKEFDEERQKKLPSPAALDALAQIFTSNSKDVRDITVSSICALMLCAPDRITEVLYLPINCITSDWKDHDTGEAGTGLRWFPLKGGAPMIKTIIPSMADIAKRAVDKLLRISEPARIISRWYEENPNKIYLPHHLEYLRDKDQLSTKELGLVLYGRIVKNRVLSWIKRNNLVVTRSSPTSLSYVSFKSVEDAVLAELPSGFPIMDTDTGMRFSESLCIVRQQEFFSTSTPMQCNITRLDYDVIRNALNPHATVNSIFQNNGLTEEDGKPLILKTHMLRHYLNTLAQQNGMLSQEDIAKWSGRKSIQQNTVYNHVSDKKMLEHIRNAIGNKDLGIGPLVNIDKRVFISRDKFAELKIVTAHTTEFGYCGHNFATLPCQIHGDCINCNEHYCVKGDDQAEKNLRKMHKETSLLLEKAKLAMEEGEYGANEWVKTQTITLERLNQLISILDNPDVSNGSVIQLSGVMPASRLVQALQQRSEIKNVKAISQTINSMNDLEDLLKI